MLNNSDSLFYKIGDCEHEIKYYYFSRVNLDAKKRSYIGGLLRDFDNLDNQNEISHILAYSIYKFCNLSSTKSVENIVILNTKDSENMVSRMLRNGYNYLDNKIVDLHSVDKFFSENLTGDTDNISYEFLCEYSDNLSINIKSKRACNVTYITDFYENTHILVEKVKKIKKEMNVNSINLISLAKPTTRIEYDYVSKSDINQFLIDYKIYDIEEIIESEISNQQNDNSEIVDEQRVTEIISKKYINELQDVDHKLSSEKLGENELAELNARYDSLHNLISEPYKAVISNTYRLGKLDIIDSTFPIKSFNSAYGEKLYELVDGDKYTVVKHSRTTKPLVVDVTEERVNTEAINLNHESRRSNRLFDIFLTATPEQNKIIRDLELTNTLITGQAGAGKTQVGLHKLSFNLYNKLIENPAIIMPSYKYRSYIKNSLKLHGIAGIADNNLLTVEDFCKYVISNIYQNISARGFNFNRPLDLTYLVEDDVHRDFFNSDTYASLESDFVEKYKNNFDLNKIKIANDHKDFIENKLDSINMYNGYFGNRKIFDEISTLLEYDEKIASMLRKTIESKNIFIDSSKAALEEFTKNELSKVDEFTKSIELKDTEIQEQREILLKLDAEREEIADIITRLEAGKIAKATEQLALFKRMDISTYIDLNEYPMLTIPSTSDYVKIDAELLTLEKERKILQADVSTSERTVLDLETENTASREVIDSNILHISQINQEVGKVLKTHDENKEAMTNYKKLADEQEARIGIAKRTIERVEMEIATLESRMVRSNTKKAITELEEQADNARERISDCAVKRDEYRKNYSTLMSELHVSNEQIKELNDQIDALKNSNNQLNRSIDANDSCIKQLMFNIKNNSPRLYELTNIIDSYNKTRNNIIVKLNDKILHDLRIEGDPYYKKRTELIKQIKDIEYTIEKLKKEKYLYEISIPEVQDRIKEKTRHTNFNIMAANETIEDKQDELAKVESNIESITFVKDSLLDAFDFELFFRKSISSVYNLGNKFDYSYYLALTNLMLKFDEELSSSIEFDYFCFDNAECLAKLEVQLIRLIENNNLLIIGDLNQSLNVSYLGNSWDELTNGIHFKKFTLDRQFRANEDFNNYARYYANSNLNVQSDKVVEYKAVKDNIDKQLFDVINEITSMSKSHETYAIICNTQEEYDTLKDIIEKSKYNEYIYFFEDNTSAFIPTGIVLTSIETAKGLEFHGVITFIQDIEHEKLTEIQKKRIYTSLSRATNKLYVIKYD